MEIKNQNSINKLANKIHKKHPQKTTGLTNHKFLQSLLCTSSTSVSLSGKPTTIITPQVLTLYQHIYKSGEDGDEEKGIDG